MAKRSLGATLLLALAAGLLAGLVTAGFHWLFTEPVLQRAIDLESQASTAGHEAMQEVVSRPVQRIGLFIGYLIYGCAWGVLFGVAYWFVAAFVPRRILNWLGLILAGIVGWAVGVLPQIKFPSNPPGVESMQSVDYRQTLYLGFLILSALGVLLTAVIYRYLGTLKDKSWKSPRRRLALVGIGYLVFLALCLFVFPAITIVEGAPAQLLAEFRLVSLLGAVIFWVALGSVFTLLARLFANRKTRQTAPKAAPV